MLDLFRSFLSKSRDKWREVPIYDRRVFSRDLLAMSDEEFLRTWTENDSTPARQWYRQHYGPLVKGKDVLDLGCGFSTDGIHFLRSGARVTFADIVKDNLAATRRVVELFKLSADYYYVDDIKRFHLPRSYDFVFALGSLHNMPFELTRNEVAAVSEFLKPGGLFLFFAYPKERYDLSGAKSFKEFGKMTDGERTPWVEWYDDAKILRLFGPGFELVYSKIWGPNNQPDFNWFELKKR